MWYNEVSSDILRSCKMEFMLHNKQMYTICKIIEWMKLMNGSFILTEIDWTIWGQHRPWSIEQSLYIMLNSKIGMKAIITGEIISTE